MRYLKMAGRLAVLFLAGIFFCLIPAAADTTEETTAASQSSDDAKSYIITEQNGAGVILQEPAKTMFWEYPALPAGQCREGSITVINNSENTVDLSLSSIELPYGDENALNYLSALHITVTYNGESLYDGVYSGIAGEDGLKIEFPAFASGESAEIHISLRCAFNFTGVASEVTNGVTWDFKASAVVETEPEYTLDSKRIRELSVLAAAVILLVISQVILIKRKKKK